MNKVYPENIIISLKNVENVEKIFQIGKNEKTYVNMGIPFFRGV